MVGWPGVWEISKLSQIHLRIALRESWPWWITLLWAQRSAAWPEAWLWNHGRWKQLGCSISPPAYQLPQQKTKSTCFKEEPEQSKSKKNRKSIRRTQRISVKWQQPTPTPWTSEEPSGACPRTARDLQVRMEQGSDTQQLKLVTVTSCCDWLFDEDSESGSS